MGCLSGEWGKTQLDVFVLKEPDYYIVIMSTFSELTMLEGQKEKRRVVNGDVVKFKYPEVVSDHYRYRGHCTTAIH